MDTFINHFEGSVNLCDTHTNFDKDSDLLRPKTIH